MWEDSLMDEASKIVDGSFDERVVFESGLRGYFTIDESDHDPRLPKRRRKNIDHLRLKDFALHLMDITADTKMLEMGCGYGGEMIPCALQGAEVHGVDLSEARVAFANDTCKRLGIRGTAAVADARNTGFSANTFDVVFSSDFVEHITDDVKEEVFREAYRVLKPGGMLVTKTPNLSYLKMSLLYRRMRAIVRLKNPMKVVIPHTPGTDDPQHIGLTNRWSLTQVMLRAGFMNYRFYYAPLRRFGVRSSVEVLSTEVPFVRDVLCEELFAVAYKPIRLAYFPD
jgi:2-polyprenyl-3-methyl-5-hydroxy-6-metoxy-1,4-benzoquinol methylase